MSERKILTLDIETAPALVWTFSLKNSWISPEAIHTPDRMICWAGKWHHEKRPIFRSEYHHDREAMLLKLRDLMDEADVIVTYNGDSFDIPWIYRSFDEDGIPVPSPFVSVDLYKVLKKKQRWLSHKLGYITQELDLSGKLHHNGFQMWLDCLGVNGEQAQKKAWSLMRRYGIQDVVTEEELFDKVQHHIENLPSAELWRDTPDERPSCPNCDSALVTRQGYKRTRTRRYPQFQCQECGRWFRSPKSDMGASST